MYLRLLIAYDGTPFIGWQENRDQPTVERSLRLALEQVLSQPVKLEGASRTDAGVHAFGQQVRVELETLPVRYEELSILQRGLNALLPPEIVVRQVEKIEAFHPSKDAKSKIYHYQLCQGAFQLPMHRGRSWHVPQLLDRPLMEQAAQELIGTHNFEAFTNESARYQLTDPIRTLYSIEIIPQENNRILFAVKGEKFLFRMVRNIVGTLVDVGRGKLPPKMIKKLLKFPDRREAGVCAPAHGLTLYEVHYVL